MNIFIRHILFIILLSSCFTLSAQDIHFTQFFANPISFNPANTGFFQAKYRLGANHKEQWPWAKDGSYTNYNSSSAYADFTLLDNKFNKVDWAGIGANVINDHSGDGNLRVNKAYLSFAYHKGLDRFHKHFISLGFTAGFVQRAINFKELFFNNQWQSRVGFVTELPNFENLSTQSFTYLDLGIGLQSRSTINKDFTITYGITLLHVNRPKETFYDQSNRLGIRTLVHSIAEIRFSEKIDLMLSSYYTYQQKSFEYLLGANLGIKLESLSKNKITKLIPGVFYRLNDAISPLLGIQYNNTRILMNFDINLSQLSLSSKGNGGFEVSIVHTGLFSNKLPSERKSNCFSF